MVRGVVAKSVSNASTISRTAADGDGICTDGGQDIVLDLPRNAGGVRIGDQRTCGICHGEPVIQPSEAEIGDRRHIDQDLACHDEKNRQEQEFPREAKSATAFGLPGRAGGSRRFLRFRTVLCQSITRISAGIQ